MSFPRTPHGEGDLTLVFEADHVEIYTLSFTIAPGYIVRLDAAHALYIARVQGKDKGLDRIREATKGCNDVSPAMMLLAAAEGIAKALDLGDMVGIGASAQVSAVKVTTPEKFVRAYDEFWTSVGGVRLARNMYRLKLPMLGKPILEVGKAFRDAALRPGTSRSSSDAAEIAATARS